ncbi:MAG TPA: right-handed parallel beta-helix repeat-containing protein [Verrucomicrobiae bacterium]
MKRRLGSWRRALVASAVFAGTPLGFSVAAATLRVPADYTTIQAAVNAAAPAGDEILIASGVYTQQVFITQKKLTLTGSPGTVLEAWTGMSQIPGAPVYTLVWVTTNADVVIRNIEFDGKRLAASMPRMGAGVGLEGVHFFGASGRVENCVFRSFRGLNNLGTTIVPPLGGRGFALLAFNPVGTTPGVVHLQVLNCTFSDTAQSMNFAGDYGPGPFDPSLLRVTFAVEGNTVAGVGPTDDFQWGILVLGGASGVIKNNRILDHQKNTSGGIWSLAIRACPDAPIVAPLQPLRIEGNTFVGNQKHLALILGDNSQVINNVFDGTGTTLPSDGIWLTGSNVLTGINRFTNLNTGVYLLANNPQWGGSQSGVAVDPSLLANQFCGVSIPVTTDPGVVNVYELGSEYCPSFPEGFGNLTCSPQCGLPGATVTLSGTNLAGAVAVLFNGLNAQFTPGPDPDKEVVATVPAHATTGPVTVITPLGNITSLTPFIVPVSLAMSLQPGGLVQLSWCADACDLVLECSSSVTTPDWQPVSTSPCVGAECVTWTGPVRNGAQFFRLRQP